MFILRLKANQTCSFTIYSRGWFKIRVHWNGKKSEPHFKQEHLCPGCLGHKPLRWKAYLHCFWHEQGQEVFVEFTPHSHVSLETQLLGGASLRGNRFQMKRGKTDNAKLIVTMLTADPSPERLPPEKDPQKSILALWGISPNDPRGGRELPTREPSKNGTHI